MQANNNKLANFVIGGTEKAGTTSVFVYLSQHPQVCAASHKETNFFRMEYTGNTQQDIDNYSRYFSVGKDECPVLMEATPGYLGESTEVVPLMAQLIPDTRLLFILRDPIDRMYSSYNFHLGKLNIPAEIDFSEYVQRCIAYDKGKSSADELGLDDWYLKVLRYGSYAEALEPYYDNFPRENIKVMFFEDLKDDTPAFMTELSQFLNIDEDFWTEYEFRASNVTFSGRNKVFHRLAMWVNNLAEPILRQRPEIKHRIVSMYKAVNLDREGYDPLSDKIRAELLDYYQPGVDKLEACLGRTVPSNWLNRENPS